MAFKKDFLWGGDISATQCEGAWNEGGKTPVETDYLLGVDNVTPQRYAYYQNADGTIGKSIHLATIPEGAHYILKEDAFYPNHNATDFYHHYKEDIALFGEMGFTALNISLSWARILPHGIKGGKNQEGVEFYRNVLKECQKYHISPIVTLYKYDIPVFYEEDMGGWSNRQLIDEFVEFSRIAMEEYQGLVKYWITFNEINVLKLSVDANKTAYSQTDIQRVFEETHNQIIAAAKAVKMAHEMNKDYQVGCMSAGIFNYPLTCDPLDQVATQKAMQSDFYYFSDAMVRGYYPSYAPRIWKEYGVTLDISEEDKRDMMEGKSDYFAFSYYFTNCVTTHENDEMTAGNLSFGHKNPYLKATDWGWQIDPDGLKYFLHELYDRYQMPLLIVENGIGAVDRLEEDGTVHDLYRIDYHKKHIQKMKEAVEEGVDLFGYTMWSCIDLCASSTGQVSKRYGFIYVDIDDEGNGTFKRYKKDSFYWYKKVIGTNGEDLDGGHE